MSEKLSIFPKATTIDTEGYLRLHKKRLTALAKQFGTPLYIYDLATVRHQIAQYREALSNYSGQTRLTYASKAFMCTALAAFFHQQNIGLDVASAGELFIGRQGGADPAQMHLHGNNKSELDLKQALDAGIGRIVVDNQMELAMLTRLTNERQQSVKIWLRVTPDVAVDTHDYILTGAADSKFGFSLADAEAVATNLLPQPSLIELTGLHLHLGSHFHDVEPVALATEKLLDLALFLKEKFNWELQELCPGGGWGIRYSPEDGPTPIKPFVEGLVAAVTEQCRQRHLKLPTLVLEPGRSLVGPAGIALYTIGNRKVIPNIRTYVSIEGGLADNPRPALYQAQYTAILADRANEPETETVTVAGSYCESGDILIREVTLPQAKPSDILAIPASGAYQLSMSSNYNGARRPAVVFIDNNEIQLVQRRQTFEDLVRFDQ